jgi:hypothetical protein
MEDKKEYYVYVYLDSRKNGAYKYGDLEFQHEPFYVGAGQKGRSTAHMKPSALKIDTNNIKVSIITEIMKQTKNKPYIIKLYTNLYKKEASILETKTIKSIGRLDMGNGPLTNLTDGDIGNLSKNSKDKIVLSKIGIPRSEETKRKLSEYWKGTTFLNQYGIDKSKEIKEKMSVHNCRYWKGTHLAIETRKKISDTKIKNQSSKGKNNSRYIQLSENTISNMVNLYINEHKTVFYISKKLKIDRKKIKRELIEMKLYKKENI